MWEPDDLTFSAAQFTGKARLFPLPNLVLFPHVMQPLHIFEPRYREMVADALASDRLLAMSLLQPGWQHAYEDRPPIAPVACLGKIATHVEQPDGRYHLMLLGLRRVRLVRELPPLRSFREAEVELLDDIAPSPSQRGKLREELLKSFRQLLPHLPLAEEQLEDLFETDVSLGTLTDLVSYTVELEWSLKQRLLSECRVTQRVALLLDHLRRLRDAPTPSGNDFPPHFSPN